MTEKKKNKGGRKSQYETKVQPKLERIKQWCMNGADDKGIADTLGVGYSTFLSYKTKYPELQDALSRSKEVADDEVVSELFKSAIGRDVEEITQEPDGNGGFMITKKVKKHIPGNVSAQIFWLKNRRPYEWRDKHDFDHAGSIDTKLQLPADLDRAALEKLSKYAPKDDE